MRLFFLFLLFSTALLGQEQPNCLSSNKITTIGYWKKGDRKRYTKTETITQYKQDSDKVDKETVKTEFIELKVVDSAEHYYILEATYSGDNATSGNPDIQKLTEDLHLNSAIHYRTDEFGSFDTILNLPQLKKELMAAIEGMKQNYARDHQQEEVIVFNQLMNNLAMLYSDLESVQDLFLTDLINLHAYYGAELILGTPQEYDLYYPMPGDIYLSGKGTVTLSSISKTTDLATINVTSRPDKAELNAAVKELFRAFMAGTETEEDNLSATITSSSKEKVQIHLSDGWLEKVEMTQTTTIVLDGKKRKVVKKVVYTL